MPHNARAKQAKLARAKQLAERYDAGETYEQIGRDLGLTRQRVWQLVRDYRAHVEQQRAEDS